MPETQPEFFIPDQPPPDDLFAPDDPRFQVIRRGRNLLAGRYSAPLFGDTCALENSAAVLYRDGRDGKKYFLRRKDDFTTAHPFDTITFHDLFDIDYRADYYSVTGPEFIYAGRDIFAGQKIDPWYVSKQTGEIKSWFKLSWGRLLYKSGGRNFYRHAADGFATAHQYEWCFESKYGHSVKENGKWRFDVYDPTNKIYANLIASHNPAFLEIIFTPNECLKHTELKLEVRKLLVELVMRKCKCKTEDVRIPHKTIACVFKHNFWKIQNRPEIVTAITRFAYMINGGEKPGADFYDCGRCASAPACMYVEPMKEYHDDLRRQFINEAHDDYKRRHHGQSMLFPEMLLNGR